MNRHEKSLSKYSLVIITGGSSGIGREFINYGFKLNREISFCNLSRTENKDFFEKAGVHHIPCDLGRVETRREGIRQLLEYVKGVKPGPILLINNSGFGSYGRFAEQEIDNEQEMIEVNVRAVLDLTHALLPVLKERGGDVINVASTAAWQPTPYLATYGATKAFLKHWGMSLNEELRRDGIRVLTLCPGPTESSFFKRAGFEEAPVAGIGQTAREVVETALTALGRGQSFVVSGWKNKILVGVGSKLPLAWQARLSRIVLEKMRLERHKK